jgi:putative ABC transport system permease protein
MNKIFSVFRNLFRREKVERELDAEVRSYSDLLEQEKMSSGMNSNDARREARMNMGGPEQLKEEVRDARAGAWIETFWKDVRFGLRMLRKTPGFTAVAILTLALGIGACSTLLSVVHTIFFRHEIRNDSRWEAVMASYPQRSSFAYRFSEPEYRELLEQTQIFEGIGAIAGFSGTLNHGEYPEHIGGAWVSASVMPMLGTQPILGRFFRPDEDVRGGPPVAIIDGKLWEQAFNKDPNILSRTVELDHRKYSIIGVMPQRYALWGGGIYLPLGLDMAATDRTDRRFWVVGVLRQGVSQEQANASLRILSDRWRAQYTSTFPEYAGMQLVVRNIPEWVNASIRPSMLILIGAVGMVLLISCVNLAALLSARATSRGREIAVRMALGAGRVRIVRQLLTESVLLALAGGGLGVLLSVWGVPLVMSLVPPEMLDNQDLVRLEFPAAAASLAIAMAMAIFFGTAPALPLSKINVAEAMKKSNSRTGGDRAGRIGRNSLVAVETALALVLLAGAGLLVRSYSRLMQVDLGFRPDRVLSMLLTVPETKYPDAPAVTSFYRQLLPRISSIPGVEAVAVTSGRPMADRVTDRSRQDFTIEGRAPTIAEGTPTADVSIISPDYFAAMGIHIVRGRPFTVADDAKSAHVALVNQSLAKLYWPNGDPVGQHIRLGPQNPVPSNPKESDAGSVLTIVGVVADAKQLRILEASVRPQFFVPLEQRASELRSPTLLVRGKFSPESLTSAVRHAVGEVDSAQPVYSVMTMQKVVADAFGPKRLTTALLAFFAGLAVTLVIVGFYAVLAYSVAQRTQEIGLRMALGASPPSILRLILGQGIRLACVGLAAGLIASLVLTRVLNSMLYGISASDPFTLVCVISLLLLVTAAACWIPARRAMKVDPMVALRHE